MFDMSQRGYLWQEATTGLSDSLNTDLDTLIFMSTQRIGKILGRPQAATICCDQRPQ